MGENSLSQVSEIHHGQFIIGHQTQPHSHLVRGKETRENSKQTVTLSQNPAGTLRFAEATCTAVLSQPAL